MSEFTASNGRRVVVYPYGVVDVISSTRATALAEVEVEALREFVVHERDTELGRWRWPENPEYVVYLDSVSPAVVHVVQESTGVGQSISRAKAGHRRTPMEQAAWAFFEAHPEPKPWHDAKPGEVWELTYRSPRADEVSNRVMTVVQDGPNVSFFNEWRLHTIHYTGIESARRIWPEVSNG